jgi:hypothetical protein
MYHRLRKEVYEKAAKIIYPYKKDITDDDLRILFDIYDDVFFDNEITTKLENLGQTIFFEATHRTSGVAGIITVGEDNYTIDISITILDMLFSEGKRGSPLALGIGCDTRLECLMLLMEHQLVHLMMMVWDLYGREPEELYGEHGSLFKCASNKFFGHTNPHHDLGIISINLESPPSLAEERLESKIIPTKGYVYWENSCYIDSLLVTILNNVSRFWRRHILFDSLDHTYLKPLERCPSVEVKDIAREIQTELKRDFFDFLAGKQEPKMCTKVREALGRCLSLKQGGRWSIQNVADMYSTLCILFPDITLDIPYRVRDKKKVTELRYSKDYMLTMWDYMDPLTMGEKFKEIQWGLCHSPVLVFTNGGVPRIVNFADPDPEDIDDIRITKRDVFGDAIIDGKYRIVGVVVLLGVSHKESDTGKHYVAYFMGPTKKWYYYNDISSNITEIDELPESVWHERGGSMPAMYFYSRT